MTKKNNSLMYWVIGLLCTILVLQLLTNFPIKVQITQTECPKIICQETICKCEITIVNKTQCEFAFPSWDNSVWVDNIDFPETSWGDGKHIINYSIEELKAAGGEDV